MIKPINNRSSRGVHKVHNEAELAAAFPDTKTNSFDPQFLIEEYIGGVEHTVEGFKTRKKHTTLGFSKKFYYDTNEVLSYRLFYSKDHAGIDAALLRRTNDALMEATGLPFGITHAEYKYYKGKFYLIEFAARGGGANISSHVVPLVSGVNIQDLLIQMAMGQDVPEIPVPQQKCSVALQFFVLPAGKVKSIQGFEEIRGHRNIVDAGLVFKPGDTLIPPPHGGYRAGHFIAFEKDDAALDALCERIKDTLVVQYE